MFYGINYTNISIVKTKGIVNEKRRGKKYPDLEITFLAFLLYNKSKKEMTDELNYIATVSIKESDNSDCDYINTFQTTLQYLKKFFNLDYDIRVSKCYFCDDDSDEFSQELQEYYDSGYYDYDSYDIEITGLSKFWHAYECYIKKACDGILIGREFEHPNKQTIEFRNIIIEKNNRSGSSEIYFSFEDISNYYKNFHLIFLELLQTKIDKKEFELTGDILGAHKRGGILPYKFRSIRISGIPKLKEAEIRLLEPNADGLADCTAQELQLCSLPKSGRTEFRISIASCSDIFLLLFLNSANSFIS